MSFTPEKRPYDRTSHILIVDDDDTLLKFFKIHLNKFFSRVLVVENAKQALDSIRDKEIDLILTDIRMPKVDGLQLMQKIRKAHPALPVLLISGEPMNDEQQKALEEGDGFLTKPFSVDQLNEFIHYGTDLRQVFKELAPLMKDPKRIRELLNATDKQIPTFAKKDQAEAISAICLKWKNRIQNKSAA